MRFSLQLLLGLAAFSFVSSLELGQITDLLAPSLLLSLFGAAARSAAAAAAEAAKERNKLRHRLLHSSSQPPAPCHAPPSTNSNFTRNTQTEFQIQSKRNRLYALTWLV